MATNPDQIEQSPPSIEQLDDGIRIHWRTGNSSFYHYFWLRSGCHCELCGDSYTGSRRLQPSEVSADIKSRTIEFNSQGRLQICWEPDGHVSLFDTEWLREYDYGDEHQSQLWQPRLWDGALNLDHVSHSFKQVETDESANLNFLRSLRDYGIAIVRTEPEQPSGIEKMAKLLGEIAEAAYDRVFQLKPDKDAHTYGNTTRTIPPHTDEAYLHTPTGILVLYCVHPADDGGESILVDGFKLATLLRERDPEAFALLATCPQAYHRIVPKQGLDHRTRARALNIDEQGRLVGFRFHPRAMAPTDVPAKLARQLHSANFALSELMLQKQNQLCFQLQAGEAVFFDNHRVMHSRKAFSDINRHLQICNVSRELFHQKLRHTARAQGYTEEANQYLPAGVSG